MLHKGCLFFMSLIPKTNPIAKSRATDAVEKPIRII